MTLTPAAAEAALVPRWIATHPPLPQWIRVATQGDDVYALGCDKPARLVKLTAGRVAWTKRLEAGCASIAVDEGGPIVALIGTFAGAWGMRIVALDHAGMVRWQRDLRGSPEGGSIAITHDRIAVCLRANGALSFEGRTLGVERSLTAVAIELERTGAPVTTSEFENVLDPPTCAYDDRGALWAIVKGANRSVQLGSEQRELGRGVWALRLGGDPAFVRLAEDEKAPVASVPGGFVVAEAGGLSLIDHDGTTQWMIEDPTAGCAEPAQVLSASMDRLVVGISTRCITQSTTFGNVAIAHRQPSSGPMLVVTVDMRTNRVQRVLELPDAPARTSLVPIDHGIVAFGEYVQRLGFGTDITARDSYKCIEPMPAPDWGGPIDYYDSPTPRCRKGYELHVRHDRSSFVAAFVTAR